jgi:hypothetical protein
MPVYRFSQAESARAGVVAGHGERGGNYNEDNITMVNSERITCREAVNMVEFPFDWVKKGA